MTLPFQKTQNQLKSWFSGSRTEIPSGNALMRIMMLLSKVQVMKTNPLRKTLMKGLGMQWLEQRAAAQKPKRFTSIKNQVVFCLRLLQAGGWVGWGQHAAHPSQNFNLSSNNLRSFQERLHQQRPDPFSRPEKEEAWFLMVKVPKQGTCFSPLIAKESVFVRIYHVFI